MNSTISFGFNGQFFNRFMEQLWVPPISPILADFVMTDLKVNCLNKLSFKPIFYKRDVDDIITGIPFTGVDVMLHCFNSYHPMLQCTF